MTMATGAKAAATGPEMTPHSRLVTSPVAIPTHGPMRRAARTVPMESRKMGSFRVEAACPRPMFSAMHKAISTRVLFFIIHSPFSSVFGV